jgi:hypothetical protein
VHRLLPLVLVIAAALACRESTVAPDYESASLGGPSTSLAGVVESASGGAQRIRPLPDGELFVLSFNAEKREDGSVTGYAHVDRKDLDLSFDVEVTCLSVVGNTAWIGGVIRNPHHALVVDGSISYFYVIDNGEGEDAAVDRASAIRFNDRAGEDIVFCSQRPLLLPATDIAHGNVQVR